MKNIYFVINDISMPGGLARVTLNLYKQFIDKYSDKYSIKIITATIGDKKYVTNNDIVNLCLPPLHTLNRAHKVFWYISFIIKLNQYLKNSDADIVLGIATMMNLCLSLFINKEFKIFATEHGAYEQRGLFTKLLRKILYKRLDKVISLTKLDEEKYTIFHHDVVTIPNFSTFYNLDVPAHIENETILAIGRFTKHKGFDLLINFIKPFFIRYPSWKLVLIGEGPLKGYIKKRVLALNLSENVIIKDPTLDIEKEYLSSSIYIMTSKTEGFPMVLLEAKAFGLPIISFDCPTGPAEIIRNGEDGFLIPMGDNQFFLEKLQLLASSRSLRIKMKKKALCNVKEFYPENVMKKWDTILDE